MNKFTRNFRYFLPLHFILFLTNWLPDNTPFLRLRGALASPFFASCGKGLLLGRNITFYNPENIHLGDQVYLAYGAWISGNAEIHIDNEVMTGPYCVIVSGKHTRQGASFRYGSHMDEPIHIGAGTWIAAHVVITSGARIGRGCLIGANAVVTHQSLPDDSFSGGIPAQVLRILD